MGAVCFVTPLDAGMLDVLEHKENLVMFTDFLSFESTLTELETCENIYNQISLKASKVGTNFSWTSYAEIIYNDISTH